ncbi:MAG: hypothetical protein FJ039_02205 [Chloroflexi bacterium]|nr:hypothetical protein [Chloroflexota bacterium]
MESAIGFLAGVLTTAAFVPQVAEIWRKRSAKDVSLWMYAIFVMGVALWLIYGVVKASLPIILANAATLALAGAILWMKVKFKDGGR